MVVTRILGRYSYICLVEKKFVTFEQLSQISSVCDFSAGRFAPLHGADGEADRREFPMFRKVQTVSRARRQAQFTRHPQGIQKPVIGRKPTRLGTGRSN